MSSTEPQENVNCATSLALPIYKPEPLKIAVLLSGAGRTFKNLIDNQGEYKIVCAASNKNAEGLKYANQEHIPYFIKKPEIDDSAYWNFIKEEGAQLVCLAGFLKFLNIPPENDNKVINIHPSLLPKFGGKGMHGMAVHKAVIKKKESLVGCTVHFCDNEYDHGEIIAQRKILKWDSWAAEELAERIFELEKELYPEAISIVRRIFMHDQQ